MPEFTTYKSVTILDTAPIGDGGNALNNNFRALADLTANYVHEQTTPTMVWTIQHNLGRPVNVNAIVDGQVVVGDLSFPSINTAVLSFTRALVGTAQVT